MTLSPKIRQDLVNYRLARAKETFYDSKKLLRDGYSLNYVVNRLYYACFHAANALLTSRGVAINSHRAVTPLLSQHFVKTGELDHRWFAHYSKLLKARMTGDYDDYVEFQRETVEGFIYDTEIFISEITILIENNLNLLNSSSW